MANLNEKVPLEGERELSPSNVAVTMKNPINDNEEAIRKSTVINSARRVSKRKCRLPKKLQDTDDPSKVKVMKSPGQVSRKRGRPPKIPLGTDDLTKAKATISPRQVSRKRGRPPKIPLGTDDLTKGKVMKSASQVSRKSGRQTKNPLGTGFEFDSNERIVSIQQTMSQLRRGYADVKTKLAEIKCKQRKLRRRARETAVKRLQQC